MNDADVEFVMYILGTVIPRLDADMSQQSQLTAETLERMAKIVLKMRYRQVKMIEQCDNLNKILNELKAKLTPASVE